MDWLFNQFPAFQKHGGQAYKPGLSHTLGLLSIFDIDFEKLKYIHVAGTNGKGSVCSIAASLLTEKNHHVGLFTSPHLFDFRERIRVNGKMISKQEVVEFCEMIRRNELDFKPSFFEITFVMAIRHFLSQNCDYVVLETGMGGRLDATNVVKPLISIITNIGLDHQQYLGNTLNEIAVEKAGIIKDHTPLVIGKRQEEIYPIFEELARIKKAPIHIAQHYYNNDHLPNYQLENINTAITAIQKIGIKCSEQNIQLAISNLNENTGYQKRMEIIHENPKIILDVSHNKEGIEQTLGEVHQICSGKVYCILGSTKEREIDTSFLDIFKNTDLYFCTFENNRSKTKKDWEAINLRCQTTIPIELNLDRIFNKIKDKMTSDDLLIVTGSFFLLADLNLISKSET